MSRCLGGLIVHSHMLSVTFLWLFWKKKEKEGLIIEQYSTKWFCHSSVANFVGDWIVLYYSTKTPVVSDKCTMINCPPLVKYAFRR